jgi:hypothetical protein
MQLRTGNKPRTGRPRDSQRARIYKCAPDVAYYNTLAEMQEAADKITRSAWWKQYVGRRSIIVRPGKGHIRASGGADGSVQMPKWSREVATLAHEIAHVATEYTYGRRVAQHGPEFAWAWLEIIKRMEGIEYRKRLKSQFMIYKVKVKAWQKNPTVVRKLARAS